MNAAVRLTGADALRFAERYDRRVEVPIAFDGSTATRAVSVDEARAFGVVFLDVQPLDLVRYGLDLAFEDRGAAAVAPVSP